MTTYIDLNSLGPTDQLATKRVKLLGLPGMLVPRNLLLGALNFWSGLPDPLRPGDVVICGPRALAFWQGLPGVDVVSIEDSAAAWVQEEQADLPYTYNIVDSEAKIEEFLSKLSGCDKLGVDTESDQVGEAPHEMRDRLVGVGVACGSECYYGVADYEPWMVALREHLAGKPCVCWNGKWDISILRRHGITPGPLAGDGMLAAYLAGEPNARLKDVVQRRLGYRMITYDEIVGTGKNRVPISQVDIDKAASYCCADAYFAVKAEELLRSELTEKALRLYEDVDLPIATILCDMQAEGIRFDKERAEEALTEAQYRMLRVGAVVDEFVKKDGWHRPDRTWTCRACRNGAKKKLTCETCKGQGKFFVPQPINLGSSDQLAAFYHDHLGLPVQKISNTGKPSMDALALLRMERLHPTIPLVLTWKRQQKYGQFLEQWIVGCDEDDRLRTSFSNARVRSHRFSSEGPNLQQVKLDWRHLFIADQDKLLVAADYAQIEVRIAAYASHDPAMLRIVQADPNTEEGDIHAQTLRTLFGVAYEDQHRHPALRVRAKNYMFGALYGSKGDEVYAILEKQILEDPSLAELGLPTINEIRKGIADVRDIYGGYFHEWVPFELERARENNNTVYTLYGRPRTLPGLGVRDKQEREAAEREAISHIIQGTATGDIIRLAMLGVSKLPHGRLLLVVHDELGSGVDKDKAEWYAKEMKEAMELGQPFQDVPLVVNVTIGQDWQSCHR